MQTRYLYLLRYILPVSDVLMLNFIYFFAYYVTNYLGKFVSYELLQHYVVVCNLIWLFNALLFGLYTEYAARKIERIYRGTLRSIFVHFILFSLYLLFLRDNEFSRTFLLVFYGLLSIAFVLNRFVGTAIQFLLVNKFHATKRIAVMGNNATGRRIADYLMKQRNVDFYGFIADHPGVSTVDNSTARDVAVAEM